MRRSRDPLTPDLFEVPVPRAALPGALDIGKQLRALISRLLKASPLDRYAVAARMSETLGQEVSKHQLDSWTAESREGWRFPLEYLPAFEAALETHDVTAWIADLRGCAEIGKLERIKEEAGREIKRLKQTRRMA
jgi:hypothetical protein